MDGLEYALWEAVVDNRRKYGQITIDDDRISRLKELSATCQGWIVFDDETEETWVSLHAWADLFERWRSRGRAP
jgi:hypothetical protein